MNPYAAPGTQAATSAEDDIALAAPPSLARVAGGFVALAGLVVGLTGIQTITVVTLRGSLAVAPWILLLLGIGHIVLGAFVFRARAWAAIGAIVGGFAQAIAAGGWLWISLAHGLFQLYGFGGPFVSVGAAVMALIAVGPCERASAARARLRAQGMDIGI